MVKSIHHAAILARVTEKEWLRLGIKTREIISNDVEHTTREFRDFERYVTNEAERLYNDPEYRGNDYKSYTLPPIPAENPYRAKPAAFRKR